MANQTVIEQDSGDSMTVSSGPNRGTLYAGIDDAEMDRVRQEAAAQSPEQINDQMYAETSVAPEIAPEVEASPSGFTMLGQDDQSFTVSGPQGVATFPKNFDDPTTGAQHQQLYNMAADAANTAPAPAAPRAPVGATGTWDVPVAPQEPASNPIPHPKSQQTTPAPVMTRETQTSGTSYDKKILQEQRRLDEEALKIADKTISAQNSRLDAEKARADAERLHNDKFITQELQRREAEDAQKLQRLSDYDQVRNEFSGAAIDSNRFWKNQSVGYKILASVGAALAFRFKGNEMLDVIDRAVDRDIDEQKANLNQKGKVLDATRTAYSDFLKVTGDERAARAATKELAMTKALQIFDEKIAEATNEVAKESLIAERNKLVDRQTKYALDLSATKWESKAAPLVVKDRKPLEDKVGLDIVDQEASLDETASIVGRLKSGKTKSGIVEALTQEATRKLGLPSDTDSAVLMKDMAENRNEYVNRMFGASLTGTEKEAAAEALAMFKDDPERAAAVLESTLEKEAEKALRRRNSLMYNRDVAPTQSNYLKEYKRRKAKQPNK